MRKLELSWIVGAFLETYESMFSDGIEDIVSVHIPSAISGTLRSAQMAKDLASSPNIHIFDSWSTALGPGVLAWAAAVWADQGWSGRYPEHEVRLFEDGAVIATHVGSGAYGLTFHPWPFLVL